MQQQARMESAQVTEDPTETQVNSFRSNLNTAEHWVRGKHRANALTAIDRAALAFKFATNRLRNPPGRHCKRKRNCNLGPYLQSLEQAKLAVREQRWEDAVSLLASMRRQAFIIVRNLGGPVVPGDISEGDADSEAPAQSLGIRPLRRHDDRRRSPNHHA